MRETALLAAVIVTASTCFGGLNGYFVGNSLTNDMIGGMTGGQVNNQTNPDSLPAAGNHEAHFGWHISTVRL